MFTEKLGEELLGSGFRGGVGGQRGTAPARDGILACDL